MKSGFWLWREEVRRPLNAVLLFVFVFSYYFPMGVAFASPGWFARPGLGVSRLPLAAMTFDAPGFGELEQAINLANGNLYVGIDQYSYNSKVELGRTGNQSGSENLNGIGGSNGWNFTPRLRLEGFSASQSLSPNLITEPNIRSSYWSGWFVKPNILPMYRLLPQDGPANCQASGLVRYQSITPGRYRVSLEARTLSGTMTLVFGIDDSNTTWRSINDQWQTLSHEFEITQDRGRLAQVLEWTLNNPAWEVGNIVVQRWDGSQWGPNLVADQDAQSSYWSGYCTDAPRQVFYRLQSADSGGVGGASSGIIRHAPTSPGRYLVSFQARTRNGTLAVAYGLDDAKLTWVNLTPQWQTFSIEFDQDADRGRLFEVFEQASGNPDWEIQNIQVHRKVLGKPINQFPSNLFLGSGDGSGSIFSRMTPGTACQTPAQASSPTFTWNSSNDDASSCIPSWIHRYKDAYGSNPNSYAFYGLFPQPSLKYASEWIVLVQTGQGTFAHYYTNNGTRFTFYGDGDYVDYSQTLHQQYRAAAAGDSEGRNSSKTDYEYVDVNSGLIKSVRDEWGRVTVYDWDLSTQRLNRVRVLPKVESDPDDWVRKIEFTYASSPDSSGRYPLTQVTFSANNYYFYPDTQRAYQFEYAPNSTRLSKLRVQTAGGWRETSYTYDDSGRIRTVAEQGKPTIGYTYDASGNNNPYKGLLVTQTQTDSTGFKKESKFYFDNQNQLRKREINDTNPNGTDTSGNQTDPDNKTLAWEYTYYQTGNLGLVTEIHTGKTTHFAYDARGNLIREAEYQSRSLWSGQGKFPPIALIRSFASDGTTMPDKWVTGIGSPFSISVEVFRDALEQGVDWYYIPAGQSPQPITASSTPVALESQSITSRSGQSYTVTANFKPIAAHGQYVIRAVVRNTLPETEAQYSEQTVNIAKRLKVSYGPVGGSTSVGKVIVAPDCLRLVANGQYSGGCVGEVPINVTFTFADWVPRSQYANFTSITPNSNAGAQGVTLSQRVGPLNIDPNAPIATATVYLGVSWSGNASLSKQDRTVSLWVQPNSENLGAPSALQMTLGFFGVEKVYGKNLSNTGPNWFPNETKDGSYYQLALRVYNSPGIIPPGRPGAGQPIRLRWYTDSGGANVGAFGWDSKKIPGCFYTWSRWWWEYYEGWIYADVEGYPELRQSEWTEMHAWQNWRGGDGCVDNAALVNYEGTVNGFGLQSTAGSNTQGSALYSGTAYGNGAYTYNGTTSSFASGSYQRLTTSSSSNNIYSTSSEENYLNRTVDQVRSSTDPATDLSSELKPNYQFYKEYAFDADNRLLRSTTVGAESGHPVTGYKSTTYSPVRTEYSYTNFSATASGQSFRATDTVAASVYVGSDLRRKTVRDYDALGRLEKDRLEWDTHWRQTAYTYWQNSPSDPAQTTSLWQINNGAPTRQWGDLVKTAATTTSAQSLNIPGHVTSKQVSYAYDLLGFPVQESINGGVADAASSSGVTTGGTRLIQRMFDGFGNQFWEGRYTNGKAESLRGWSYHGTGELQNEFTYYYGNGGDIRLTAYSYDAYGRLTRKQSGEGTQYWFGTVKPDKVSGQVEYTYDEWGRVKEEKVLKDDGNGYYTTSFAYDSLDRPVKKVLPDGTAIKTWYDVYGEVSKTDEPKSVHVWRRYWDNYVFKLIDSVGAKAGYGTGYTITHTFDEFGRTLKTQYNNLGSGDEAVAKYAYDSEGNLIGEVGPQLRPAADAQNPPRWLQDTRRSGSRYTYDKLGRKVSEQKVLYLTAVDSGASLGSVATDPAVNTATTQYVYDHLDRLVRVVDAEGYYSETAYDAADQPFMTRRGFTPGANPSYWATSYSLFDAGGRVTEQVDPEGFITSKRYDPAGNLRAEANQNGYVTKLYTYSPGGLLLGIYEPKMSAPGNPNSDGARLSSYAFNPTNPNAVNNEAFVLTEWREYGKRGLPKRVYRATQDSLPSGNFTTGEGSGGAATGYTYTWQGKPDITTLPDGKTTDQDYDYQGNLTAATDPDGFRTTSSYDWAGRLLQRTQHARGGGVTTDADAGLAGGLSSSYAYDAFGNLLRKVERGLVTDYVYNSAGKVIAESRPTYSATPPAHPLAVVDGQAVPYKKYVYRLDGGKMAEASYTYADSGNLRDAQDDPGGLPGGATAPVFSAGNLQIFRQDKLGNVVGEYSYGYGSDNTFRVEKQVVYSYNGLGLPNARDFIGHKDIYANQRNPANGLFLGGAGGGSATQHYPFAGAQGSTEPVTAYSTYWHYDKRGKLLKQWDEVDTGATPRPKFNEFTYTYSPTGKEIRAERDVRVRVARMPGGASTLTQDPLLAATVGRVESDYNERDLLKETRVYDQSPGGVNAEGALEAAPSSPQRTTRYTYYADGSKRQEEVVGVGTKVYSYDSRGRVTQVNDSNGALDYNPNRPSGDGSQSQSLRIGNGAAVITNRYLDGGVREEKVQWTGTKSCYIQNTYTPTVGGLTHKTENVDTCQDLPDPDSSGGAVVSRTPYVYTYKYDSRGLVVEERGDQSLTRPLSEQDATPPTQTVTTTVRSTKIEYNPDFSLKERVIESTTYMSGYTYTGTRTTPQNCEDTGRVINGEPVYQCDFVEEDYTGTVPATSQKIRNRQVNAYNAEGHVTREIREGTLPHNDQGAQPLEEMQREGYAKATADGQATTSSDSTYTLDSRGNRLTTTQQNYNLTLLPSGSTQRSGDKTGGYSGYIKRYNAEDRVVMFYKYVDEAKQAAYSDFAYDPSGNQVLSSSAAFKHDSNGYVVSRDQNANYFVNGEVQLTRKRAGLVSKYPPSYFLWWQVHNGEYDAYSSSDTYKDQTYSLADGHADTTKWAAVVLFEGQPGGLGADPFQAPVRPTSLTVGVEPLTVNAPDQSRPPAGGVPPRDVTPPAAQQQNSQPQPQNLGQGQGSGTVQGFSIAGALQPLQPLTPVTPADSREPKAVETPTSTNTDSGANSQQAQGRKENEFRFEAPLSALPPSIEAVSPSSVALPDSTLTSLPTLPDPTTVATPGQASPPPTSASPQDGPITVAPPIGDTSPPPVSPGGDDRRVRPPPGWVPGGQPENREAQLFVIYVSREQWKKIQESGLADDLEEALRLDQAMRDGKLGDQQARERAQQLVEDVRRKLNNLDRQGVLLYGEINSLNKILDAVSKFQDPLEKVAMTGRVVEYFLLEFDAARRADTFYQMANSAHRLLQAADGASKQRHKEVMWSRLGQGFGKMLQAMDTMARDAYQMSGGYREDAKAYVGAIADYILENPVEAMGLIVGLGLTLVEAFTFLPVALTAAAYYGARLSAGAQNFLARVQAIQAQQARLGISPYGWVGQPPTALSPNYQIGNWTANVVLGRRVWQNNNLFDPNFTDPATGLTNIQRMQLGRPPIGYDGRVVQLHHSIQEEPGPMIEISTTLHRLYARQLHGLKGKGESFRNDPRLEAQYEKYRQDYWKKRAEDFLK